MTLFLKDESMRKQDVMSRMYSQFEGEYWRIALFE